MRYYDADCQRPGLPKDVAALVTKLEAERTALHLLNLNPFESRTVIVQAGGFGEHQFLSATYETYQSEYPGSQKQYAPPPSQTIEKEMEINERYLQIKLPPATQIKLDLTMQRFQNQPSYLP